jgi:methionyl-tRNA formyltransferase
MNFVFIGGTYRGYKLLEAVLSAGYVPQLIFILKEDDHETVKYSEQAQVLLAKHNLSFSITKKISKVDYEKIKSIDVDFAIVCGWRTLINTEHTPNIKLGYIAAHDSLLPKYRGFAPLNWAIINGEKHTGVTLFLIENELVDSGRVINQAEVIIEPNDYGWDVHEKVTAASVNLYLQFFKSYPDKFNLSIQNEAEATYTCSRTPEDGKIDWQQNSDTVYNLIRALAPPYPGAYCTYNNENYIIHKACIGPNNHKNYTGNIPGRVIGFENKGIEVLCNKGSVLIELWENTNTNVIIPPGEIIKSIKTKLN